VPTAGNVSRPASTVVSQQFITRNSSSRIMLSYSSNTFLEVRVCSFITSFWEEDSPSTQTLCSSYALSYKDALDVLFCWLEKIPHRLHFYITILKVPPHGWRVDTRPQCDRILDRSKDCWYSRDLRVLKLWDRAFCSFWQPGSLHCESGVRLYSRLMEALRQHCR
jgi:hypothetical protein